MIAILLALQAAATSPLGPIGTQSLPARGCAAYLWSTADRQLVAMASADPARLRLRIDGKVRDLARSAATGQEAGGLGGTADYRGDDVVATLTMSVERQESLTQGARVPDGVLTVERKGGDGFVVPVAGLIGCAA